MAAICRVATTHDTGDALDALLARPGWQTLTAIAQEHARPRPSEAAPRAASPKFAYDGSDDELHGDMDDESDAFGTAESGSGSARPPASPVGGSGSGAASAAAPGTPAVRACPHCTYEGNPPGASDCEVCGLPM